VITSLEFTLEKISWFALRVYDPESSWQLPRCHVVVAIGLAFAYISEVGLAREGRGQIKKKRFCYQRHQTAKIQIGGVTINSFKRICGSRDITS
jgi:hypothetical protein